jgi:hypothetical protein
MIRLRILPVAGFYAPFLGGAEQRWCELVVRAVEMATTRRRRGAS